MHTVVLRTITLFTFLTINFNLNLLSYAQDTNVWVVGHWQGILTAGSQELQLVYHISTSADGGLEGTMDVPAQGALGIPLSDISATADSLRMTFPLPGGGAYAGHYRADKDLLEGMFSQGEHAFPLHLERTEANTSLPPRPQEPKPPFPYVSEEVAFSHTEAGITLHGTLTRPQGDGPFPGIVLVSGAGPHDRDGTMMGHKPFWVLADHLTKQGIAVLRFDERGTAASEGDFGAAMPHDLAGDAAAALAFLSQQPQIVLDRVGLLGHSDGARVALLAARQSADAAYLVLLGGSALPAAEGLAEQARLMGEATGMSPATVELSARLQTQMAAIALEETNAEAATPRMIDAARAELGKLTPEARQQLWNGAAEQVISQMIQQFSQPQTRFMLQHDPRKDLADLSIPVLALFGTKDLQMPAAVHAPALQEAVAHLDATVEILPGLNHFFQEAETGAPTEYAQLEQTLSPQAMTTLSAWINERFR